MQDTSISNSSLWGGRIVSSFVALFLLLDGTMKLFKPAFVVEATVKLGYPENALLPIGVVLILGTIVYLIPATSTLGAILLTGFLGGAVATHVRTQESVFSIVFPIIWGILVWLGLYLRDPRLRTLVPVRTSDAQSQNSLEGN